MRRKIFSAMLILIAGAVIFSYTLFISADDDVISGSGSKDDPYLISTQEQLKLIKDLPEAYYKLTKNIEISETWSGNNFSGELDGDGYKITVGRVEMPFIYENRGTVKNLSIYIENESALPALFIRNNYGTVENVHVSGNIRTSKAYYLGTVALINYESGIIKNTYSTADISYSGTIGSGSGTQCYGVFVGDNKGSVENCYWRGYCYQVEDFAGNNDGTMTGCILGGDYGKSDTAMRLEATYTGWDFENTWKIDSEMNDGFPCLMNEREFIKIFVSKIQLSSDKLYIEPGEEYVLTAEVSPDDAWNKNVIWSSSNEEIAKVTQDGVVTGVRKGECVIKAQAEDGEVYDECTVTVGVRVKQLDLNYSEVMIDEGEQFLLSAAVFPDDADNKNIIWTSQDPEAVTVDNGYITGYKEGVYVIRAESEDGGAFAECTVHVLKNADERFDMNNDGIFDMEDAELLADYLAGVENTGITEQAADTNGDGKVNSRDVTVMLQYLDNKQGGGR